MCLKAVSTLYREALNQLCALDEEKDVARCK